MIREGLKAGRESRAARAEAIPDVEGDRDVVILKSIEPPAMEEFNQLVRRARAAARNAGVKPADVRRAISRARAAR